MVWVRAQAVADAGYAAYIVVGVEYVGERGEDLAGSMSGVAEGAAVEVAVRW